MSIDTPGLLLVALLKKSNWQLAAFLGSLIFLYRSVVRFMEQILEASSGVSSAVAGAVAGLSMMFERSQYLSLYLVTKALELSTMHGIKSGYVPHYRNFDVFLFALCCGIMYHSAIVQPTTLGHRYLRFLKGLTANAMSIVNRKQMDAFGYGSSRMFSDFNPDVPLPGSGWSWKEVWKTLYGPYVPM